jgi:putative ABC transport system substrate-binding protein
VTDRRRFIGSVAGGLFCLPASAWAQPLAKVPRIGTLASSDGSAWEGFRQKLRELGYVEGRNIAIDWRWAQGRAERFPELARELVQSKVDLIVTVSTQAALAAKQATSTIPIVMAISAYPEKVGLVESLARPGGNVTGFSNIAPDLAPKRLQLLKEMLPTISRVAVLRNPENPLERYGLLDMQAAGSPVGVQIREIDVRTQDDYPAAFATIVSSGVDAMHVIGNPVNFTNAQRIVDFTQKIRLPSVYDEKNFVKVGGLMSYGPSFIDMYRRAATYVDKILQGAKPADLPIQQPTSFEFAINKKAAEVLGLAIPPSLLVRADEIFE